MSPEGLEMAFHLFYNSLVFGGQLVHTDAREEFRDEHKGSLFVVCFEYVWDRNGRRPLDRL